MKIVGSFKTNCQGTTANGEQIHESLKRNVMENKTEFGTDVKYHVFTWNNEKLLKLK